MNPLDQTTPAVPARAPRLSESRRVIGSALLAIGLLAVGGVAIVSAASPSPAASSAPSTTTPGNGTTPGAGGGATHDPANCPDM